MNKRLDSTPHLIADEVRLEKLKYAPKGECKPTFGMPIPEAILSGGIKETQVYADYVTKYPQAQTAPMHGMGKSLMRRGAIPTPKKKKDAALKHSRSITAEDNVCQIPTKLSTPESPDYSSSSDDSSESATDDKTESGRESDHDESDNDSEHGDESDKSASDEESTESDESDNDSNNVDDQTKELVIKPLNKEP
ncbi:hypothetical protein Tco_0819950 [Tanacetum coccineum]|uniref:Uncharacterized protein n=1 Tax=Tanacetum coccineum TaxID=301880 RepID=A0ABQ5A8X0_9ASTR